MGKSTVALFHFLYCHLASIQESIVVNLTSFSSAFGSNLSPTGESVFIQIPLRSPRPIPNLSAV